MSGRRLRGPTVNNPDSAIDRLRDEHGRLRAALVDVVAQACTDRDGRLDSLSLTAYRDALELLAELGDVTIESRAGRRIVARWTPAGDT